ncbi:TonB-dependent receptor [Hyalangium rubrum]|uniref:Carboxypeptidase regulatory-like domain-containing protein n=1 Tax=Hyalangium rubrum TaxID=3103134 RepID=A0ABU5HEB9_9BACT|nr:carboxypeptidase regulatory-like domain-containing protein [Hyalangium sp. s54d21]MDY7231209.1 carboxypeptidase regulatory-like domain-containing protein [Hyalangium sp. s54d21]
MDNPLRPSRLRLALVIGTLAIASTALAQGVTGAALTGTITTTEGKPLPDAVVELRNESTGANFTAVSDSSGEYLFDNVPPGGPYTLTVSSEGFYGRKRTDMRLVLANRLQVNVELFKLETMEESISVVGTQADELMDRGRTGPSKTLSSDEMIDLPIQGRNFTDLISTAPQVSGTSMAGQNNRFNNIQIDGASYNDLFGLSASGTPGGQSGAKALSIEAIESFVVQVSPFDVRYGNFAGGMVNAITKSGTNDFRGSVFGYFQNKELAGNQSDPTFLSYNTWQYGLTLGGPIVKDKVHFFITADLQERASSFGNVFQIGGADAEADAARAGFTSAEADRFSSILAETYGVPNAGNGLAPKLGNPDRNVFAKVSTSVIPGSYLELSYNFVNAFQDELTRAPTSPSVPGRMRDGYQLSNSGYAQATASHIGRAKLVSSWLDGRLSNEFLAGFSIIRDERDPGLNLPLILVKAGTLGAADSWLAAGAERFSQLNELDQNIYQLQDSLTYKMGDHAITLGTTNEILQLRNAFLQAATGVWTFDSLDDFEAGNASAFQRRFGVSELQEPGTAAFDVFQLGLYLQDTWTPLKGLSVTPGIRVDVPFLSAGNVNQRLLENEAFRINTGEVPSGNPLWSPRLGVNWDVDGGNTIVRGGVGVFSGRPPYVWVANAYSINGLSQVELTCQRDTGSRQVPGFTADPNAQPFDCAGGTNAPESPVNQGEIDYFDPDTKYLQNLRVAVGADRRLPFGLTSTVDVLYTQDINGWYTTDENLVRQESDSGEGRALYGTFASTGFRSTPERIDNTNLRQAIKVFNKNGGRVFSGTFQLRKDIASLVDATAAYTYTNAVDRMSLTSSQALSNFQFSPIDGDIQNRNVRPSAFDRTHRVTLSATATLPLGFNAGLIYVGQSGLPYTWTVNGDVNADGISGNDVAFIPANAEQISLQDASQYEALNNFINGQDCLRDAKGGFVRRGACRNPWQNILDMRLGWNAPEFVKGQHLELQMDIFNVLNLVNSDWGLFEQEANFETHGAQFLRAVGYDTANNRPIYSFTEPTAVRSVVLSPTRSRWRIQLGARYVF